MILRVIVIAVLMLLVVRAVRLLVGGIAHGAGISPPQRRQPAKPVKLVRDPVCGTHVTPRDQLSLAAGDTTHYFCSEACREKFRRH